MDIRRVTTRDDAFAAQTLFDGPARPDATARFLAESGHHMLVAYVDGAPAGMVSGVETTHPDKGTEMFLYELGVAEEHRNGGIGTALVRALGEVARECGCYGMWVLTDRTNTAAMTAYTRAGGADPADTTMLTWTFVDGAGDR
ncbi:MAG TPA: GNAT family N-acetyltransferase [Streptosporangiaceae bacterium]|jgi:GNAT superfamily N-acetyltransferase